MLATTLYGGIALIAQRHKLQQLVALQVCATEQNHPSCIGNVLAPGAMCMSRCCLPGEGEEIEWNIGCLDILGLAGCMHAKWAEVTSARRRAHGFPTGYHSGHHSGDWSSRRGLVCQMLLPLPPPHHTSAKHMSQGISSPYLLPIRPIKSWLLYGGPCQLYIGVTWGRLAAAGFWSTPGGFDGEGAGAGWYPEGGSGRGGAAPPIPPPYGWWGLGGGSSPYPLVRGY